MVKTVRRKDNVISHCRENINMLEYGHSEKLRKNGTFNEEAHDEWYRNVIASKCGRCRQSCRFRKPLLRDAGIK